MAEDEKSAVLQSLNEAADGLPWDTVAYVSRDTLDTAHFVRALTRAVGLEPKGE